MKKMYMVVVAIFAMTLFVASAFADVYVKGYTRKDGTYVAPHYRSSPNSSKLDNWSTKGNVNPYTGKEGTQNIYPSYGTGYQTHKDVVFNTPTPKPTPTPRPTPKPYVNYYMPVIPSQIVAPKQEVTKQDVTKEELDAAHKAYREAFDKYMKLYRQYHKF